MKSDLWNWVRLGEICCVTPGYAFKSQDWQDAGIPVVKIKNITVDCTVDLSDCDHVPERLLTPRLEKFMLKDGDILLAMTGATAGKVGRIRTHRPVLLNQRVAKIEPVSVDYRFLWSVVSSRAYQSAFFKLADGAAQPNMSGTQIESVKILLPPLMTQRKIAAILSAYDDLIENNTRRIQILEEMARTLYREWFVEFRFPGHETVPMMETELGQVPHGWRIGAISEVVSLSTKQLTPLKCGDEKFLHFSFPAFDSQHMPLLESGDTIQSNKIVVTGEAVLLSKMNAHIPRIWFHYRTLLL